MTAVLVSMAVGLSAGVLLRGRRGLLRALDPATGWTIRVLLLLLGYGIGGDAGLLSRIPALGLTGLAIAVSAILGSVTAARLILGRALTAGEVPETGNTVGGGTMSGSLVALAAFSMGLVAGRFLPPIPPLPVDPADLVLYLLMVLVGAGAGADPTALTILKRYGARLMLLPAAVVVGTLAGTALLVLAWPGLPLRESLAVGAGFGYYSLSSLIIREVAGNDWAAVALLSNISREILTLLTAPLLVRIAGPAASAAAGGATSMDTTLAAVVRSSGRMWTVPALFSGIVLTVLTPFAVTLILGT